MIFCFHPKWRVGNFQLSRCCVGRGMRSHTCFLKVGDLRLVLSAVEGFARSDPFQQKKRLVQIERKSLMEKQKRENFIGWANFNYWGKATYDGYFLVQGKDDPAPITLRIIEEHFHSSREIFFICILLQMHVNNLEIIYIYACWVN